MTDFPAIAALVGILLGMGLGWLLGRRRSYQMQEGGFMYIVKADNPDVRYVITPPTVTDSEGNTVPADSLTFEVSTSNPQGVEVTPDPADPLAGSVHFGGPTADGTPAVASVVVLVKLQDGAVIGSFGAQFTVTAGDPAAIVGGSIAFEGLAEAPVAPPPPAEPPVE